MEGQPPCQGAGVQMYGITQRILTAEIVQPNKASWSTLSASALRHPSWLKPAAANRTRPALDRSACCSRRSLAGVHVQKRAYVRSYMHISAAIGR